MYIYIYIVGGVGIYTYIYIVVTPPQLTTQGENIQLEVPEHPHSPFILMVLIGWLVGWWVG